MSQPEIAADFAARHAFRMAASDYDRAIGGRLQRLRKARGWTMPELARRCGGGRVTASQINKLEKGQQQFSASWLYRLADALECSVIWLMIDRPLSARIYEPAVALRVADLAEPDHRFTEPDHRFIARIVEESDEGC